MSRVIINDDNLFLSDVSKFSNKVRAVLLQDHKFLIAYYGGVYLFPGGSIEKGEDPDLAIIRELKEETGITYDISDLERLYTLKYYQKKYPTKRNFLENKLMLADYYIGEYKGIDLLKTKRTEREKRDHFSLQLVPFEDISSLLNEKTDNPRKEYFDREIEETVKVLKMRRKI